MIFRRSLPTQTILLPCGWAGDWVERKEELNVMIAARL